MTNRFILSRIDIWLPAAIGLLLLLLLLYVAGTNPNPSPFQIRLYLVLLALASASFAALIPGLLRVALDGPGVGIRAAGALAVFVLVFFYEPAQSSLADSIDVGLKSPEPAVISACKKFTSVKALGWKSGHKTKFCQSVGYQDVFNPFGDYSAGGYCFTGEKQACIAAIQSQGR